MNLKLILLSISGVLSCHEPGHRSRVRDAGWLYPMEIDMGWKMPLKQFTCRDPILPDDDAKSIETVSSWRCDTSNYDSTNMFLRGCMSNCLNTFCGETKNTYYAPINALDEYFSFLYITDWYAATDETCQENLKCWTDEIQIFEQKGLMYQRTTLKPTNVENALVYCSGLLNTYQPIEGHQH